MISLTLLATPFFRGCLNLDGAADAAALQRELLGRLKEFAAAAEREGHVPALIEESRYALCALADELICCRSPLGFAWLPQALVKHEFQDAMAGSHFFDRLRKLLQRSDARPALEVSGRCLLLGFRGKYRLEDDAELRTLLRACLDRKEAGWRDRPWFGGWERPGEDGPVPAAAGRPFIISGSVCLGVAVAVYAALSLLAQFG